MTSGDATPEPGSWRIVWRALRTGQVENPRYEALTRQTAERRRSRRYLAGNGSRHQPESR